MCLIFQVVQMQFSSHCTPAYVLWEFCWVANLQASISSSFVSNSFPFPLLLTIQGHSLLLEKIQAQERPPRHPHNNLVYCGKFSFIDKHVKFVEEMLCKRMVLQKISLLQVDPWVLLCPYVQVFLNQVSPQLQVICGSKHAQTQMHVQLLHVYKLL